MIDLFLINPATEPRMFFLSSYVTQPPTAQYSYAIMWLGSYSQPKICINFKSQAQQSKVCAELGTAQPQLVLQCLSLLRGPNQLRNTNLTNLRFSIWFVTIMQQQNLFFCLLCNLYWSYCHNSLQNFQQVIKTMLISIVSKPIVSVFVFVWFG